MIKSTENMPQEDDSALNEPTDSVGEIAALMLRHKKSLLAISITAGALGYAVSFLIPPTFTAKASFISPQPQQSLATSTLSSLGALSGIAGAAAGIKNPADQYVSLMQSITVSNRIIERFDLQTIYDTKYRADAQRELARNVRINTGKKDSIISIEVDDNDPSRAAKMANAYIEELKSLSNTLALTEAQQRRKFFESQLGNSRDALKAAQSALQNTGFSTGALRNEPKAAAEAYAKLKADIAAAEVKFSGMRTRLTENAPEIQQQQALIGQMRAQLNSMEQPALTGREQDYISAYREYKYQEALFDIYARQFEVAKMDEAREGTLIQVLDSASPPERKSKPRRSVFAIASLILGLLVGTWRAKKLEARISQVNQVS